MDGELWEGGRGERALSRPGECVYVCEGKGERGGRGVGGRECFVDGAGIGDFRKGKWVGNGVGGVPCGCGDVGGQCWAEEIKEGKRGQAPITAVQIA